MGQAQCKMSFSSLQLKMVAGRSIWRMWQHQQGGHKRGKWTLPGPSNNETKTHCRSSSYLKMIRLDVIMKGCTLWLWKRRRKRRGEEEVFNQWGTSQVLLLFTQKTYLAPLRFPVHQNSLGKAKSIFGRNVNSARLQISFHASASLPEFVFCPSMFCI